MYSDKINLEWSSENIKIESALKYIKYKWVCSIDNSHRWETTINKRLIGRNCPDCAGRNIKTNNLLIKNPGLLSEWDYTRNKINPSEVTPSSHTKVWWICKNNHSWESNIHNRNIGKCGCPYCNNKLSDSNNNLLLSDFEKCKDWNYNRNIKKPEDYLPNSNKKVWWICENGHEWETSISNKGMCMECNKGRRTSLAEESIKFYLSKFLKIERLNFGNKEVDIFLPEINLVIEYDGSYYHKNKINTDIKYTNMI